MSSKTSSSDGDASLDQGEPILYVSPMSMGTRIKSAREGAGLSQPDLAKLLDVSTQAISNWERDKNPPGRDNLRRLSEATGADLYWLQDGGERERQGKTPPASGEHQLTPSEAEAIGRACVMFMERNSGRAGAERWLEALTAVIRRRGGNPDLLGIDAIRWLVQNATDLLEAGWLPENPRKS